jgi:hypothetical protein
MRIARVSWLFSVLLLTILVSCNSVNINGPDDYVFEYDDQYYFFKPNVTFSAMAESKKGFYFFSGQNNEYLYYMDKSTLKPVILCNKPDCLHSDEPDPGKIQNCNAFFGQNSTNLIYYNKYLYVVGQGINLGSSSVEYSLYRISPEGTNRKKIYTFKDQLQHLIIHRGYIYYSTDDNGPVGGNESDTESTCRLYRLNIDKIGTGPEMIFEGKGIYCNIGILAGYRNDIYFMFYKIADTSNKSISCVLYRYNLDSMNIDVNKDSVAYFVFYNDRMTYSDLNGNLATCNLDGTDVETISGITGTPLSVDNNYIYIYTSDSLAIYDLKGNIVRSFDKAIANGILYGGYGNYFFIQDNHSRSNDFGYINSLYMIDKSKALTDEAAFMKVFEYTPKVPELAPKKGR